jgi:hypothetical protein
MGVALLIAGLAVAVVVAVVLAVRAVGLARERDEARRHGEVLEASVAAARQVEDESRARIEELKEQVGALELRVRDGESEIAALVGEGHRLAARVDDADGEVQRLTEHLTQRVREVDDARAAALEAESAAVAAVAEADAAHKHLAEVRAELERARELARQGGAAPTPTGGPLSAAGVPVVDGLWALERARTERTWRHSVATGVPGAGPFDGADDALRTAVEIEAAALREEVGTEIATDWRIEPGLPADLGLLVLRAAQELLASASRTVEDAVLVVEQDGPEVVLGLRRPAGEPVEVEHLLDSPTLPGMRVQGTQLRVGTGAA